jgi:tellurite methyltransferase
MNQTRQEKWNERYLKGAYGTRTHPSALLTEWLPKLQNSTNRSRAIDIACGTGRNSIYLAQHGWQVDAYDISEVALELLEKKLNTRELSIACFHQDCGDAENQNNHFMDDKYNLAVVIRYTNLSLIQNLYRTLKVGGYLIVEEHLVTNKDVIGPKNPQFRVPPKSLYNAAGKLKILSYREGLVKDPDGRTAALAQLVAEKS